MTDDFTQSPRSRVAEAEKQLRIAGQYLSEKYPELGDEVDDVARDVKAVGDRIETEVQHDGHDQAGHRQAERSGRAEPVSEESHSPAAPDTDAGSGESRHDDANSEGPHAR